MLHCCIGLDLYERLLLPVDQPALTVGFLFVSGVIRLLLPYQGSLAKLPIRMSGNRRFSDSGLEALAIALQEVWEELCVFNRAGY